MPTGRYSFPDCTGVGDNAEFVGKYKVMWSQCHPEQIPPAFWFHAFSLPSPATLELPLSLQS